MEGGVLGENQHGHRERMHGHIHGTRDWTRDLCSHSVAVCFTISGTIHPFSTCSSYSQGHGGAAADSSRPWGEGGVKPPDGSAVIARPMLR